MCFPLAQLLICLAGSLAVVYFPLRSTFHGHGIFDCCSGDPPFAFAALALGRTTNRHRYFSRHCHLRAGKHRSQSGGPDAHS